MFFSPKFTRVKIYRRGASANALKNGNKCAYMVSACRIRATHTVRLLLDYGAMTEDLEYLRCLQVE